MRICRLMATLLLVLSAAGALAAEPDEDWSRFQVRLRGIGVLPDRSSASLDAGATHLVGDSATVTNDAVPEVDVSYFFTRNIALEAICCVSNHTINGTGGLAGVEVGSTWVVPLTATLQYHVTQFGAFEPYFGIGVNYSLFFAEHAGGGPIKALKIDNSVGVAGQVGFDYMLDRHWGLNLDLKKVMMEPEAHFNGGAIDGTVDIDPWIVGAGVTYRF